MTDLNEKEYKRFEEIKHRDENGDEYWFAREQADVLGYLKWQNFPKVIDRAMLACKNSGQDTYYHFTDVGKMIDLGKGGVRKVVDYMLSDTAHNAGVITLEEYAIFQNAGYIGLYAGEDENAIHGRKGLRKNERILDFMNSSELVANLFRITQAEERIRNL